MPTPTRAEGTPSHRFTNTALCALCARVSGAGVGSDARPRKDTSRYAPRRPLAASRPARVLRGGRSRGLTAPRKANSTPHHPKTTTKKCRPTTVPLSSSRLWPILPHRCHCRADKNFLQPARKAGQKRKREGAAAKHSTGGVSVSARVGPQLKDEMLCVLGKALSTAARYLSMLLGDDCRCHEERLRCLLLVRLRS